MKKTLTNKNLNLRLLKGSFYVIMMIILVSCESHVQNADETFDSVKEGKIFPRDTNIITLAKMEKRDSIIAKKEIMELPKKIETVKKVEVIRIKNEVADEWTNFRNETENKIQNNTASIKLIKENSKSSNKSLRKVARLEKENNDLRKQIDEYSEEVKMMREKFKTKINHDANEISIELKDLTTNNK